MFELCLNSFESVFYNLFTLDKCFYHIRVNRQQFKAAPLDRKVLEGTATGTKIREPAKVTQPLPVQFATDQRVTRHASRLQAEESPKKVVTSLSDML